MGSCYITFSDTLQLFILILIAIRSISGDKSSSRSLKISGKSCKDALGQQGFCVFKWDCIRKDGILLSTCMDGFLFGTCCKFFNDSTVSPVPPHFRPQNYYDVRRPTQLIHRTSPFHKFSFDFYRTTPYPKLVTWTGSSPYHYSQWYMPHHKYTQSYTSTVPFRKTFSSDKYKNPTTALGTVTMKNRPHIHQSSKNGNIDINKTAIISSNYILIFDNDSPETSTKALTKHSSEFAINLSKNSVTNDSRNSQTFDNANVSEVISEIDTVTPTNQMFSIEDSTEEVDFEASNQYSLQTIADFHASTDEIVQGISMVPSDSTELRTSTLSSLTISSDSTVTTTTTVPSTSISSNKSTVPSTSTLESDIENTPEALTIPSSITETMKDDLVVSNVSLFTTTESLSAAIDNLISAIATIVPATTSHYPSIESNVIETIKTEKPIIWNYKKQCGVRPLKPHGRIVGGLDTYFGKWPWQALVKEATWLGIFVKNKCGGVLINDRYVLTAAHCQPGFLSSLIVILGEYDLSGDFESLKPITRNVKKMIVHRDYNSQTFENDLALLKMDQPVEFQPHIVAICLPEDNEDFTGKIAHVSGWGKLSHGGSIPNILQEVHVPIVTNSKCQKMFLSAGHIKAIRDTFICAGYENGGQDSCEGDSGGPLMIQRENGLWVLVGTVSHGIRCADPNLPGVYMRMTSYKTWIKTVIETA